MKQPPQRLRDKFIDILLQADIDLLKQNLRKTIPLPWSRLSEKTNALKPGTVVLIGGPTKVGKSFFIDNILLHLIHSGISWAKIPLEDSKKDNLWRFLAILSCNYQVLEDSADACDIKQEALNNYKEVLPEIAKRIWENPRYAEDGVIRPVTPDLLLEWVDLVTGFSRVVVIDPIAQIEFDQHRPWEDESKFLRSLLAIAAERDVTIVCVGHCVKRPGVSASYPLTESDFQGSANWTRLSHTVILIDGHEPKESDVYRMGCDPVSVEHNRTVYIAAARHGSGTRMRLAFNQDKFAPVFDELGVIVQKKKK